MIPEGTRVSPVQVLRALCNLVINVARYSASKVNLRRELEGCVIADESSRHSDKNSKNYPRKKRKRQTGEPNVHPISDELRTQAFATLA